MISSKPHGTPSTYKSGCRCEPCTIAHRIHAREYQRTRAATGNRCRPRKVTKLCTHCGIEFATRNRSRFCSNTCSNLTRHAINRPNIEAAKKQQRATAQRARHRGRATAKLKVAAAGTTGKCCWVSRGCIICGNPFRIQWKCSDKTCSVACQKEHAKDTRREGEHRRRARKRNAYVADVHRRTIYEQDGWTCHLCGKAVNRNVQVPHPEAATIDRVIPLAKGGTHEPSNVRTAHFICNCLKGDRAGDQLLLLAG